MACYVLWLIPMWNISQLIDAWYVSMYQQDIYLKFVIHVLTRVERVILQQYVEIIRYAFLYLTTFPFLFFVNSFLGFETSGEGCDVFLVVVLL